MISAMSTQPEAICINWLLSPPSRQGGTLSENCPDTCALKQIALQLATQNNWTVPDVLTIDRFYTDPDPISQGAADAAQDGIRRAVTAFLRTYNMVGIQQVSTADCEQLP